MYHAVSYRTIDQILDSAKRLECERARADACDCDGHPTTLNGSAPLIARL